MCHIVGNNQFIGLGLPLKFVKKQNKNTRLKKYEMRASMTLLVSKKAGSQMEPLTPLLDKMWSSSGAVLQWTV